MSRRGRSDRRGAVRRYLRPYASRWTFLSIATLLYWLATQSLRPYVSIHLASLGASEFTVGLAIAAHPFLSMLLAIPAGRFMDMHGLRRTMSVSLVAMATVGVGYALLADVGLLIGLQAMAGLTELGAWVGIQAMVTRIDGPVLRKRHLGLFAVLWAVGVAAGPTVGAFAYELRDFVGVGTVYAVCAMGALAALLAVPDTEVAEEESPASLGGSGVRATLRRIAEVARRPGVAPTLVASAVMLWANNLRVSFYPLFLERAGVPVTTIGYLISLAGITLLLSRVPLPWLLNRYRSLPLLITGTVAAVLAVGATPLLVGSTVALWVAAAVFGLGFGLNSPVTIDVIADGTDPGDRGLAMGMRVASNRVAQVGQPLAFGAVAGPFGMAAGFGLATVVMMGSLTWAALRSRGVVPASNR